MAMDNDEELKSKFKLVCLKCQSEKVYAHFEESYNYSEHTQGGGSFTARCDGCDNQVYLWL
jgi:hypothetical protein